jgi:hypothetical protein
MVKIFNFLIRNNKKELKKIKKNNKIFNNNNNSSKMLIFQKIAYIWKNLTIKKFSNILMAGLIIWMEIIINFNKNSRFLISWRKIKNRKIKKIKNLMRKKIKKIIIKKNELFFFFFLMLLFFYNIIFIF